MEFGLTVRSKKFTGIGAERYRRAYVGALRRDDENKEGYSALQISCISRRVMSASPHSQWWGL